MVVAAVAAGVAMRAWLIVHQPVTSDEAVAGLIAHQILHGHNYAFFWGQPLGGVEPYVVAAVFALFGQSSLTLGLAPVLLSAASAIVVWRVALRFTRDRSISLLAGALAWASPYPVVFTSTIEGGYRGITLLCGLSLLLISLRILDGRFGAGEFIALGLVAGVGWWSLPEIDYLALPSGLILIGAMVRWASANGAARFARQWSTRVALAVVGFAVGALPWLWVNVGSGFPSLDTSKFPGAATPLNPGFGGRLRLFATFTLPMYLNLRRLVSGHWLFGNSGTPLVHQALLVALVVVAAAILLGALVLCFLGGGRCVALGVAVVLFPLLLALQPATWFWQDGRYAVYLGPLIALVLAVGCKELGTRWRRGTGVIRATDDGAQDTPPPGSRRPRATGRVTMGAIVVASVVLTVLQFHQATGVTAGSFTEAWGNRDGGAAATAAALEARGIRFGYADYWVAYKLDFVSRGAVSITVAGSDPDRWEELTAAVRASRAPAWLFVPPAKLPEGLRQFSQTYEIEGPSSLSETSFLAGLQRLGIPHRTVDVGPLEAVLPGRPVTQEYDGSIAAARP